MKEFTIREFNRIGLTRAADRDFKDDGSTFKIWTYKNLEISYTKDNSGLKPIYYIAVRFNWRDYSFTSNDVMKESWYKLTNEFNYCENPDADKLLENLEIISKGVEDLEKRVSSEKIDVMNFYKTYSEQCERAKEVMEKFRNEFDWIHADEWVRRSTTRAYKQLESDLKEGAPAYKEMSIRALRLLKDSVEQCGFVDYDINHYTEELLKAI